MTIPPELQTYAGFRDIFLRLPSIEGLVAYTNAGVFKIRREMYQLQYPYIPAEDEIIARFADIAKLV